MQPHRVWGSCLPKCQRRFCFHYFQKKPQVLRGAPLATLPPRRRARGCAGSSRNGLVLISARRFAPAAPGSPCYWHCSVQAPSRAADEAENGHQEGSHYSRFLLRLKVSHPAAHRLHISTTGNGSNIGVRLTRDTPVKLASEPRLQISRSFTLWLLQQCTAAVTSPQLLRPKQT